MILIERLAGWESHFLGHMVVVILPLTYVCAIMMRQIGQADLENGNSDLQRDKQSV